MEEQKELEAQKEIRLSDVKRKKSVSESDTERQKEEEEKQIEGQMDIIDYPECLPEAEEEKVVSESDTEEWFDKNLLEDMIAEAEEKVESFWKSPLKPDEYKKALMQVQAYMLLMDEYVGDVNE